MCMYGPLSKVIVFAKFQKNGIAFGGAYRFPCEKIGREKERKRKRKGKGQRKGKKKGTGKGNRTGKEKVRKRKGKESKN